MSRVRASILLLVAALVLLAGAVPADAAPRRVLLLYSYEREFSHYTFASLFRPELTRTSPESIDFIETSLQTIRRFHSEPDAAMLDELRGTLGERPLDLVVTIGGPAAAFVQKYGTAVFRDTPTLLAAVDSRFLDAGSLPPNETAVTVRNDPRLVLDAILQLLPNTKTVMVVVGASALEHFWIREIKRAFEPFAARLSLMFTDELTLAEMLKRSGSLPAHSVVLYGIYSMDAAGVPQMELQTLDALHASANAPMFGLHSHQLGHGIVGGPLLSLPDVSRDTAAVALRLLHGERPSSIAPRMLLAGAPTFDARELRRWGITEHSLQPGSTVLYRDATPLPRDRGIVAAAATFLGAQTLLVIGLVVTLLRRRNDPRPATADAAAVKGAEAALARLTHRLMQAQEDERAHIATALHEDVCQQLIGLKIRLHTLGLEPHPAEVATRERIEELCQHFSNLERQIVALTDPVYAKLDMLGLAASARALCQRACHSHNIALEFHTSGVPANLCSRVTLALFRVLQEAMDNVVMHAAARRVRVSLTGSAGAVALDVVDDGMGFDPEATMREAAVGLIAMRERLHLVGGECTFQSRRGAGTHIHARVRV